MSSGLWHPSVWFDGPAPEAVSQVPWPAHDTLLRYAVSKPLSSSQYLEVRQLHAQFVHLRTGASLGVAEMRLYTPSRAGLDNERWPEELRSVDFDAEAFGRAMAGSCASLSAASALSPTFGELQRLETQGPLRERGQGLRLGMRLFAHVRRRFGCELFAFRPHPLQFDIVVSSPAQADIEANWTRYLQAQDKLVELYRAGWSAKTITWLEDEDHWLLVSPVRRVVFDEIGLAWSVQS